MNIECKAQEKQLYRYIHVNPETNRVHLLMPIVGGVDIATDNTCQSPATLKRFFGVGHLHDISALKSLGNYKADLENDIEFGGGIQVGIQGKTERLVQVKILMEICNKALLAEGMQRSEFYYPQKVKALIEAEPSVFTIALRPRFRDLVTDPQVPIFTMQRDSELSYEWDRIEDIAQCPDEVCGALMEKGLPKELLNVFKDLQLKDIKTDEKKSELSKEQLIEIAQSHYSDKEINVGEAKFNEIKEYINGLYGRESAALEWSFEDFKDFLPTTTDDCIENLINSVEEVIEVGESSISPFSSHKLPKHLTRIQDKLMVLTQFFLAQVNIYCVVNKLTDRNANFGKIFDDDQPLSKVIAAKVMACLRSGAGVEDALLQIINNHQVQLQLGRPLTVDDQTAIIKKFKAQWGVVKDSEHFDDFMIFDGNIQGATFVSHHGAICTDFTNLAKTLELELGDDSQRYIESPSDPLADMKEEGRGVPGSTEHGQSYNVNELALLDKLLEEKGYDRYVCMLWSLTKDATEDKPVYLFEKLSKVSMEKLQRQGDMLEFAKLYITGQDLEDNVKQEIINKFNRAFGLPAQYILDEESARRLYVGTMKSNNGYVEGVNGYRDPEDIEEMLQRNGLGVNNVTESSNGLFLIGCHDKQFKAIKRFTDSDDLKFIVFLPKAVVGKLLPHVKRQCKVLYGATSEAYQELVEAFNDLNDLDTAKERNLDDKNYTATINKSKLRLLKVLLRWLDMGGYCEDLSAQRATQHGREEGGYLLVLSDYNRQRLADIIHQRPNRIFTTQQA
jgi:hypothetical protein